MDSCFVRRSKPSSDIHTLDSALLQVADVLALPRPKKDNLAILRDWLSKNEFRHGLEFWTWEKENEKDLIAVDARADEDLFTKWFSSKVLKWYHWFFGHMLKVCLTESGLIKAILLAETTTEAYRSIRPVQ